VNVSSFLFIHTSQSEHQDDQNANPELRPYQISAPWFHLAKSEEAFKIISKWKNLYSLPTTSLFHSTCCDATIPPSHPSVRRTFVVGFGFFVQSNFRLRDRFSMLPSRSFSLDLLELIAKSFFLNNGLSMGPLPPLHCLSLAMDLLLWDSFIVE